MRTPYLKFHKEILINNLDKFYQICEKYFKENFEVCYSVKTNTSPEVLKTLTKEGIGFEIASMREMKLTKKDTFRTMNGPAKTYEELKEAIKEDVLIFIDSFSELEKIIEMGERNSRVHDHVFGIRLGEKNSKFGFDESQLKKVFKIAKDNDILISGFQLHQGTLNKFSEFKKRLKSQKKAILPYMKQIKYLDFGGGYPDNFQLKNLSLKLEDYMKEIKQEFKDFKGVFIFEPGRNLVSDAYTLTTQVITIKEKEKDTYAVLDAGLNILSKITLANYKFNKLGPKNIDIEARTIKGELKDKSAKTYILAGPLLFGNDILGKWHGKLIEGDYFEVENVGAYCENLSWEIIYARPRVL